MYAQNDLVGRELNADDYESVVRGTPMFPCGAYLTNMSGAAMEEIPWHWHEDIEVLLVRSGVVRVNISGENFSLKNGEGAFINSSVLHSACVTDKTRCTLISLVFNANLLSGSAESVFEQRYVRPLLLCRSLPYVRLNADDEWSGRAVSCIKDAYEAYNEGKYGYELIVREKLSQIWYLLVTNKQPIIEKQHISEDKDVFRIKAMISYLHQRYAERINLDQIAAAANISQRECLRCFRSTIGISPMQYLLKYRLSVSARLLSETPLTITEICMQSGFEDPSHFARAFKSLLLCTPSEYRKTTKQKGTLPEL